MKKYFKYLSFGLLAAISLSSCDAEDDLPQSTDVGGYSYLSQRSITAFDTNADLNINIFTAQGVTAQSIEVMQDGQVIGTANISGESATFNTSNLDSVATGKDSWPVKLKTTFSNGNVSEDSFTISAADVITIDGDNPSEVTLDSLSTVSLSYDTFTRSATIDDMSLWLKKNSDGTYTDSGVDVSADGGTINLSSTNYDQLNLEVNDTLYYQFNANSGSLSASAESYITIVPKAFTSSNSATLSSDPGMNQLNLQSGEITADGDANGEIAYLAPAGFTVVNNADISFVPAPSDYFDNADVLSAKQLFEAGATSGTEVTSVTNVAQGDTYVYKATRAVMDEDGNPTGETTVVYGVIKVENVTTTTTNGNTVTTLDLSVSEGQ
ncbi:MAG: hypothetical protein WBV47_10280 [Salegentibacter sp.]